MTNTRRFFPAFLIGLSAFLLINILVAHLHSDCGLPAVLGLSACADDIVRIGFPLTFLERGGFDGRAIFQSLYLFIDIVIGFIFAICFGYYFSSHNSKSISE